MKMRMRVPKMIGTAAVLILAVLLTQTPVFGLDEYDVLTKVQSWIDARDDGAYTADLTFYSVEEDGTLTELLTGVMYWQDDPNNGWSMRCDMELDTGCESAVTYTMIDTPTETKAFLGDTCVYADYDLLSNWTFQPHTDLPQVVYAGDPEQTAIEALQAISDSASVSEQYIVDTLTYKLTIDYDISALNDLIDDDEDVDMDTNDSLITEAIYRLSDGMPMSTLVTHTHDSTTYKLKVEISNINTSPTIPAGTFTPSGTPSSTLLDAMLDWMDENCE